MDEGDKFKLTLLAIVGMFLAYLIWMSKQNTGTTTLSMVERKLNTLATITALNNTEKSDRNVVEYKSASPAAYHKHVKQLFNMR